MMASVRARPTAASPVKHAATPKAEGASNRVPISGRVVGPDGKPVAGAAIFIRNSRYSDLGQEASQVERVASAGPDGRFQFDLDPAKSDVQWPLRDSPAWHNVLIAAVAPGRGFAWVFAGDAARAGAELRLAGDDTPIHGRLLDSQGRPVAGAGVRVERIAVPEGGDLDALLASGRLDWDGISGPGIKQPDWYQPTWLGERGTVKSDAEGRFEIAGVGRDRVALLAIEAPGVERARFVVLVRASKAAGPVRPRSSPTVDSVGFQVGLVIHGASFEHVLAPSKPITGVVLAKGTRRPAAGVIVAGQIWGQPWTVVFARTAADGRFRLEGLPKAASYHVGVRTQPGSLYLQARAATVSDTEGLKPVEVSIELPPGVVLRGRIVDKTTGRALPIDQAHYFTLPTNPAAKETAQAFAGVEGETFVMTVPPGGGMVVAKVRGSRAPYPAVRLAPVDRGKIVVQGEGGAAFGLPLANYHAYRFVDLAPGSETARIGLEVAPVPGRRGRIVGPDGRAASGVKALGLTPDRFRVEVVDGGTFEVQGLSPGETRVVEVRDEALDLAGSATFSGSEAADQPVTVQLARCGELSGRVLDEDGLPLRAPGSGPLCCATASSRHRTPRSGITRRRAMERGGSASAASRRCSM